VKSENGKRVRMEEIENVKRVRIGRELQEWEESENVKSENVESEKECENGKRVKMGRVRRGRIGRE
jgi:hypothetical protein